MESEGGGVTIEEFRVMRAAAEADRAADPGEILQRLYDSEINAHISWQWDAGIEWEAWVGSDLADGVADEVALAARDMAEAAACRWPGSEFARWWNAR